jgi:Poly (ADP-ribose) glycohydrolase (PARG)
MECLYRRGYDADRLLREHPPELSDPNKLLVFELALSGERAAGTIGVTRWNAAALPTELAATELVAMPGYYDYAGDDAGVWHVNFADPHLFFAYGSSLLAQDELQCAEHPALGSVREALVAAKLATLTEERGIATPVLVTGAERRCTISTAPSAERPRGLYGNEFAHAGAVAIRAATTVHRPAPRSNLIAIAAPVGGGAYTRKQIEYASSAAYTGFAAAVEESSRLWPGVPVEVRTGFWGCGAFGGNRELMTMLQLFAARLAGVARLRFYAFDDAGRADYERGVRAMTEVGVADVDRMLARGYVWGRSNGT